MSAPLILNTISIASDCLGERWVPNNLDELARFVAMVAMGQSSYAGYIVEQLLPAAPLFSDVNLRAEAKILLTVQKAPQMPRVGYPVSQRDGFIFETISWLAARHAYGKLALLKDPHVRATQQGLDGLMIELSAGNDTINRTTIFEDKCTEDPRSMFTSSVMPGFHDRHENKRSAELISCAATLIKSAGVREPHVTTMASAVTDLAKRRYRAAFAVVDDTDVARQSLFKGFGDLPGLAQDQRLGACFVVSPGLREWFEQLAKIAVAYLDQLGGCSNV